MMRVAGLVLAGGRGSRLGGVDKPLLQVGGASILARVIDALRPEVRWLAISANGDPARFSGFGAPVLPDGDTAGEGPLAGLAAGLAWAAGLGAEHVLTAPGDTPFLPSGLARSLAPPPSFAARAGVDHPLVALWPVAVLDRLRAVLSAPGSRAVAGFGREIGMRRVEFPASGPDPFMNINTPDDLATARAMAENPRWT
ncbi:MAG: molybdenum cofactor guanylyltransferase [Alphaproteobacteria bacterium]|nr:molybdenum cofactor guanylyltransferase [Alphaproteobacteria bacterium]